MPLVDVTRPAVNRDAKVPRVAIPTAAAAAVAPAAPLARA